MQKFPVFSPKNKFFFCLIILNLDIFVLKKKNKEY